MFILCNKGLKSALSVSVVARCSGSVQMCLLLERDKHLFLLLIEMVAFELIGPVCLVWLLGEPEDNCRAAHGFTAVEFERQTVSVSYDGLNRRIKMRLAPEEVHRFAVRSKVHNPAIVLIGKMLDIKAILRLLSRLRQIALLLQILILDFDDYGRRYQSSKARYFPIFIIA